MTKQGYNWDFGASDEAFTAHKIEAYPTTVFIDRQGNVKDTVLGGMGKAEFEAKLAQIL